jgi:hypothetical protein
MPYSEAQVLADEWFGHPPPEAAAAIERGERDLSRYCPVLGAEPE